MAESIPPQLGDLPQHSELNVPTLSSATNGQTPVVEPSAANDPFSEPIAAPAVSESNSAPAASTPASASTSTPAAENASKSIQNAKDTVANSKFPEPWDDLPMRLTSALSDASSAYNTVANHPTTQKIAESVNNAPVTQVAKDQAQKTSTSVSNLAASRKTPSATTAGGQPLTHYHSFFYTTLSWQEPHATALSYAAVVSLIFAARYLNVLPLVFKTTCWVLGSTAAAEVIGRTVLSQGLATAFRPRRYYTIPRETLEATLEDIEQLINFFVIEFQRIVFAENVLNTILAFVASLTAYLLIKFVPFWGLSLITVTVAYFAPLVYITNKEVIDDLANQASELVNQQASQVKGIVGEHSANATSTLKSYAGDYTAKAQEYIGSAKPKAHPPAYSEKDFPAAPRQEPAPGSKAQEGTPIAI